MPSHLRLVLGREGWWAVLGPRAALLPREAATATAETPSADGAKPIRQPVLTSDATAVLREAGFFDPPTRRDYAVTVLTSTACNLGCDYCFQNTALPIKGSHAPPRIRAAKLGPELIDAVADFVRRQQAATGRDEVTLLIFGGEPLLNHPGCLRLLRALAPLGMTDAQMVTNGVLLTPRKAKQLVEAGLRRAQVTFDGPRGAHDQVRVTRNGRPTYAAILANVLAAAAAVPQLAWNFRVNVSHHNVDGLDELVADLIEVSRLATRTTFSLALIDDIRIGYANDVEYDTDLARTFALVNTAAIRAGMNVPLSSSLRDCPYCSVVGGDSGAVINADGTLFSCWENAGREGWDVGDVTQGYADPDLVARRWVACDFDRESHGSQEATRRFFDAVDAATLDEQRAVGRLQAVPA